MQALTTAVSKAVKLNLLMLNLTVSVHAAVGEDKTSANKIVCMKEHSPTPTRTRLTCPECSAETGFVKARVVGDGLVVIPPEVIAAEIEANAAFKNSIELTVHPVAEVTSVLLPSGKSYYLSMIKPTLGERGTYTLLGKLLRRRPDLAFMTKLSLRSAATLFQLTVAGDGTLVLRQMADAELVRQHPVIEFADLDERALELAEMLADQQVQPFVTAQHGVGRSQIIAEYALGQTPIPMAAIPGQASTHDIASVTDFTAHLEAMVKAATTAKKAPARKRAPRKPAATKVA